MNGKSRGTLRVVKSLKLGEFCLGIDRGPDGALYTGVSLYPTQQWIEQGGSIYRLDMELLHSVRITPEYPALNGLAFDKGGHCYFASSNFSFLNPKGSIYMMMVMSDGKFSKPEVVLNNIGLANGVHYNLKQNRIYLSDTLETVSAFSPGEPRAEIIYRKTKYMESIDDLCTDNKGFLWMSDPFDSTVKHYNPDTRQLVRYDIKGVGQTSSCGIRVENGEEILYITEIKTNRDPMSNVYDGRGILIVPVKSLIAAEKSVRHSMLRNF
ncbi:MAG: SMP-30/gluconolactonase/LRE family protein [Spirochaetes bacterium]|nr:SMP-30/gluconolactonase/LRE family protein [Spirochaetota bacterium]